MIKKSCFTILFTIIAVFSFAQDIIVTTDAQKIEAKILEVSESEIKYKEIDNIEGPTFILSTNRISLFMKTEKLHYFKTPQQKK